MGEGKGRPNKSTNATATQGMVIRPESGALRWEWGRLRELEGLTDKYGITRHLGKEEEEGRMGRRQNHMAGAHTTTVPNKPRSEPPIQPTHNVAC